MEEVRLPLCSVVQATRRCLIGGGIAMCILKVTSNALVFIPHAPLFSDAFDVIETSGLSQFHIIREEDSRTSISSHAWRCFGDGMGSAYWTIGKDFAARRMNRAAWKDGGRGSERGRGCDGEISDFAEIKTFCMQPPINKTDKYRT